MSAHALFRSLMGEPGWAAQGRKVCWLAARYYAGVDSRSDLMELTVHQPCLETAYGDVIWQKPILTVETVQEIVRMR